eukprot:2803033-Pyramimonas_sp.AAC.1
MLIGHLRRWSTPGYRLRPARSVILAPPYGETNCAPSASSRSSDLVTVGLYIDLDTSRSSSHNKCNSMSTSATT